ncbi:S41 family peptidase [Ruminococcus sp. AF20-12LB]|uniref:S41 family peptidase n=1 Tax=Ruminococcus sp. AF20-12LB TaxID=2293160 RepID=UPI000E47E7CB|nr:S41 family peptidase [Ruminococcus sp. AF20-12LB]RHR07860.1 S41 family peptidase [Ruminococcus sp. AF20-12LB]
MKNKEFKKGIAIGVASTLVVTGTVFASYQKMLFPKGNALSDVKTVQKLNYLEELIDKEYLDEKDESSLREGLYAGLLAGLKDPYSTYYTAEQYKELNTSNEGSYVGIGAVLQKDDAGGAKIIQLYEGGPGEQVGLKKGDVIKAVDGTDVTDKETSDIASMVRDSEKDSVMLTIQRENEEKTRDVKVEIRDVEIQTVSHEMLSEDTGYIRISEFSEVTSDQYKKAFADLKDQGMKKLVVDLRDNPGGLLTAVCGVLRQILPEGLIVYTEDKNGKREEETCDGKNKLDMPLAVLVNGNSASASEIFAGAVKDYGIGTIVGTTTYGKGVVQTIHSLTDGSAVKITIAKYFTPKGNDINKKGINPDVEAELSGDITDWTELTHKEDTQLQTALKEIGQS